MIHDLVGIGLAALLLSFAFTVILLGVVLAKMMWDDE